MKQQKKDRLIGTIVLSVSLVLTSGVAVNGTLPMLKEHLSLTQTQSELLATIPSVTVVIFLLLSNKVVERIGMKKTVLIGLTLAAIGGTLPALTPNSYPSILFGRLLLGTGLGLYNALSVNYINALFKGRQKSFLLGIRNAMENIGQMVLTSLAGVWMVKSWEHAYYIYLIALPIAVLFAIFVPDVQVATPVKRTTQSLKLPLSGWLTILFASSMLMNAIAISVRFPTLGIELKGVGFPSSQYLALLPILGIVAGILFQPLLERLSFGLIYLALVVTILSNLLIALSSHSFLLLVIGLFISSIPVAWVMPYIFNHLTEVSGNVPEHRMTSFVFVGCNLGVFSAPLIMRWFELLGGADNLRTPFVLFIFMFSLILILLLLSPVGKKRQKKAL